MGIAESGTVQEIPHSMENLKERTQKNQKSCTPIRKNWSRPREKNPILCLYFNILKFASSSLIHLPRSVPKLFFLHECAHVSFSLPLVFFPSICFSFFLSLIRINKRDLKKFLAKKIFKLPCFNEIILLWQNSGFCMKVFSVNMFLSAPVKKYNHEKLKVKQKVQIISSAVSF